MGSSNREPQLYPIADIPLDLNCRLCEPQREEPFKNQLAFRAHAAAKHGVKFESKLDVEGRKSLTRVKDKEPPQTPQELRPWHRLAIVKHEIYGDSWDAIAEEHGKSGHTIREIASTPAGQRAIQEIRELTTIKGLTQMLLENAQLGMFEDWLVALDWAKQARDYKTVHSMLKDVGLQPTLESTKRDDRPQTIMINLSSGDLDAIQVKQSYTMIDVEAEVVEDDG